MIQIQRTVLIQRDDRGFGLRVSGDKPVYVESVKLGEFAASGFFGVLRCPPA